VESTRVKGKPVQKTILNSGNIEDWPPERVADLIARLTRFFNAPPKKGCPGKPEKIRAMVDRTLRKRGISVWFTYTVAPDGQLTFQVDDAAI